MRLADDRRGRVPFALIGVLLLVGSATLAVTMVDRDRREVEVDAEVALDRGNAVTQTVLRDAVADASRRAAANPVVTPANTTYGRVLNDSTPFRDYLRIRIYRTVQSRLAAVDGEVRSVGVRASLPPVTNASTLRDAKRRVSVERDGEGRLDVVVRDVRLVAERDGREIASRERSIRVTVPTPALLLHDRVERYQTQLNRGPLDGSGFGQRVTARLYAMTWTRGYAQYGGGPISNVLANRHVELAANGAMLETQRDVFGRADPVGRAGLARGAARVGITDAVAGAGLGGEQWVDYVLGEGNPPSGSVPALVDDAGDGPSPSSGTSVGVNFTADEALYDLLTGESGVDVDAVRGESYATEVRLAATVDTVYADVRPRTEPDGEGWVLNETTTETRYEATDGRSVAPNVGDGHALATYRRVVAERHVAHRRWTRGNETRITVDRWTTNHRVSLRVVGTHTAGERVPDRPVRDAHDRGGALDGPNLVDVERRAVRRLVTSNGGADELAIAAVEGEDVETTATVVGRQPPALNRWVYDDLRRLRDRIRNVSVTVERSALGTRANPPGELAAELQSRRASLVDAPDRYDGVADRARIAVRAAYVDRTIALLERRADAVDETQGAFNDALGELGSVTDGRLEELAEAGQAVAHPGRHAVSADGGSMTLRVDGAPSYLTINPVGAERVSAVRRDAPYHPLVARNENVAALPYGEVGDRIAAMIGDDTTTVGLRTAAQTLRQVDRVLAAVDDRELATQRDALRDVVRPAVQRVNDETAAELAAATAFDEETSGEIVAAGMDRWDSTAARALAQTNRSAAAAIASAAADRSDTPDAPEWEDRIRTRLRVVMAEATTGTSVRPPEDTVRAASNSVRERARTAVGNAVSAGLQNASDQIVDRLNRSSAIPSGIPVTPVPGYWYATANAWQVNVSGRYAGFTVRTGRDAPTAPGGTVAYSRDGSTVEIDVDGDGQRDRLGRSTRVSFSAETTVLVVVPPGRSGVGDVDGNRAEESPGWPTPGYDPTAM
jgi:hypothetical protein